MSALLEVKGLKSGYGRIPILFGVDLTVADGEYLGILGHNGMGKTTALRTLMGHLPTTDGSVVFAGKTITHLKPHERSRLGIGLVPQGREIFPDLSVMENLRMGLAAAPKEDRSVIDTVLQDFPRLVRLLDRRGGALSGGEQQLLALARCLCTKPKLILLDEPTEGIQPSIIEEIIETLLALKTRWKLSLIVVEQNLEFITSLSDRILHIQKGRITEELDRESLLAREGQMVPS
ncbi:MULTISPECIES: ABC transporter ATP-binding protein [Bradyrhizobium]|jgi:branched-chain amino acid transport system ATP-binding protein/urea transport system ATP-binding protein|uniref:ATP-binding cassette domain-containing protein n=2 Tax=Bradyrhizobium TaxID=374 RepID=A0ABS5G3V2_9BRAD|nr:MULTISPECIES: ATP-binding cassette domain-containing protein [Bradyrhizobium]RTL98557.1 MAG: ATP-binding cassette domain-containing protein [Bradyrhizobiaceae bacterium]ABQ36484.1 amino acid/amide ABC transporter ATP-binding protein 2, HAAT family [Bradyrhizobium sp. BTAi1]MBR1135880.1 ATP-binding cassette domain-containing protein [Bradyrhizobium denitrificans]MDU1492094.1 ATP-binding cassette domain-containing protein [Bradyrhizobium sp.]MDU1542683.1 ATP-binding cassette domain-containing